MQAKDAFKSALTSTQSLTAMYLGDLSDLDLHVKPVPSANNVAWQLAHLISSEAFLGKDLPGASYPELPATLQKPSKTDAVDPTLKKADYLEWFNKVRSATIAAVMKMNDADFDRPNPGRMKDFAPTLGDLVTLLANHTLMHAGQFTVVRRALGKPVLF